MSDKKTELGAKLKAIEKREPEVKAEQAAQKKIPGETPGKEELGAKLKAMPKEQPEPSSAEQTDAERVATLEQEKTQLLVEVAALNQEIGRIANERDSTIMVNQDLTNKIETGVKVEMVDPSTANRISAESFKSEGKEYEFAFARMTNKDGVITANEVIASEALQRQLIESGSGMIRLKKTH